MPTLQNKYLDKFSIVLLIVILLSIVLSISFNTNLIENFSKEVTTKPPSSNLPDDTGKIQENINTFSKINETNYHVPKGISNNYVGNDSIASVNQDDTVITYNFDGKPNINNVFSDLLNGIAITDKLNVEKCINFDQIAIKYEQKTCDSQRCYDRFGNKINDGDIIEEAVYRDDISRCQNQSLGYLSFNFDLNSQTNLVSRNTLFTQINKIFVNSADYQNLNQDNNLKYYFARGLFVEDSNLKKNEMVPEIVHRNFNRNDFRQKLIIKRYDKGGIENPRGKLAEIFFRPAQLYLTVKNVNNAIASIQFAQDDLTDYSANYAVRKVAQEKNAFAKCLIYLVSDQKKGIYIVDGGENFDSSKGLSIEKDNGLLDGNFSFTTLPFNRRLMMDFRENQTNDEKRAQWLLVPPTDLSPQGVTKNNKLSGGYILDYSTQSPVKNLDRAVVPRLIPPYSKVIPGDIIMPIDLNNLKTTIYNEIAPQNICTNIIGPGDVSYQNCDDAQIDGQNVNYYKRFKYLFNGHIVTSVFSGDQNLAGNNPFTVNQELYSQYPPYLLKAVNNFPMFADPQNLTTDGTVVVFVYQYKNDVLGRDYQVSVGVSQNSDKKEIEIKDGILLDGSAEWQTINTFEKTFAFRDQYFNQNVLDDGTSIASIISDINSNQLNFVDPVFGKVDQINITNSNYADINLPNFSSSILLDLNSDTLTVETDDPTVPSKGVIGFINF